MSLQMLSDLVKLDEAARWWNTERPLTHPSDYSRGGLAMDATRLCSESDCGRKHYGKGWCQKHYQRDRRSQKTEKRRPTAADRFWAKVQKTPDCWIWTGATNHAGYGKFKFKGGQLAHRFSYIIAKGSIPKGLTVDHICFNPGCVNPEHLQLMTVSANAAKRLSTFDTHCSAGHEFTQENTRYVSNQAKNGNWSRTRRCRSCTRVVTNERGRIKRRAAGLKPHWNSLKSECPNGHLLTSPNLVKWSERRGQRQCLACARTRATLQAKPDLPFQVTADEKYAKIMRGAK